MAKLISIEKSKYINQNIDIYTKNKIGQFSKFLNKNPIFVTYYHINQQLSRADSGTGGILSELGEYSPVRFNKINEFPLYNMPEIKPDVIYDESGFDIELDLSGVTILPNTIKPLPGDYILLVFPGIREFLFRINNVSYNSIQSNDFYIVDLDIKDIGTDLEFGRLKSQIVETYQTIFDNIGTQDRCFIKIEDIEKLNGIVKNLEYLKELYVNLFYNEECNSFMCPVNGITYDLPWHYDYYIEAFIVRSNLYYEPGNYKTLVLTPNDILPPDFEYKFSKTLLYAVLNHSIDYINECNYFYSSLITKPFSPFRINGYITTSANIILSNLELTETECSSYADGFLKEYFDVQLIKDIKSGELSSLDYIDSIIFNYMNNINIEIDKNLLIQYPFIYNLRTYMYMPIIMYIILWYYNSYFTKEDTSI